VSYTLHRGAERDLEEAYRYYRAHASHRIALRLLDEFERVAELLVDNPGFGTPTGDDRRC